MKTKRPSPLTQRMIRREGQGSREMREQAEQAPRAPLPPVSKVVYRDTVLELCTQLRDFLDGIVEQVNDLARTIPSLQQENLKWHDLSDVDE